MDQNFQYQTRRLNVYYYNVYFETIEETLMYVMYFLVSLKAPKG